MLCDGAEDGDDKKSEMQWYNISTDAKRNVGGKQA